MRRNRVADLYFGQKKTPKDIRRIFEEEGQVVTLRAIQNDITHLLKEHQKEHKSERDQKIGLYKSRLETLYGRAIDKGADKLALEVINTQLKVEGAFDKEEKAIEMPTVIRITEADQSSKKLAVVPNNGDNE